MKYRKSYVMKIIQAFKPSPNTLFLSTFAIGICLWWWLPLGILWDIQRPYTQIIAITLLLTSLAIAVFAYKAFKTLCTPYAPFSNPTHLITYGIFSYSRNPVYLALVLSQVAFAFIFEEAWLLLTALLLMLMLDRLVIKDEESVLQGIFKETYEHYRQNTRRWL